MTETITGHPGSSGASSGAINTDDIGYDVILLAGQSNMKGVGTPYDLTRYDPIDTRILQYGASGAEAGVISQAVEPLSMIDPPTGIGPGMVFARWYLHTIPQNRRVLLVPHAEGSTGFFGSVHTWNPTAADDANNLYERSIDQANAAIVAAGPNSRIVAILWIQGERDSGDGTAQATYRTKLDALISGFRSRITGASDCPFILGRMVPEAVTAGGVAWTAIDSVHVDTPYRVPHVGVASGPAGLTADNLHYTAPGQRILGRAMFDAYRQAKIRNEPLAYGPINFAAWLSSLIVTAIGGVQQVVLDWNDLVHPDLHDTQAYDYRVATLSNMSNASAPVSVNVSNVTITGLTNGTTYYLQVRARDESGNLSAWSTPVSATPNAVLWTPISLTELRGWYKANDLLGVDGSGVSSWDDKSGNARHAPQPTGANQPALVYNVLNGKKAVRFNGTSHVLGPVDIPDETAPITVIIVGKTSETVVATTRTAFGGWSSAGAASNAVYLSAATDQWGMTAGTPLIHDGVVVNTGYHAFVAAFNGATSWEEIDGVRKSGTAGTGNLSSFTIGANGAGTAGFWFGDILEVILMGNQITAGELASLEGYLNTEYGIVFA